MGVGGEGDGTRLDKMNIISLGAGVQSSTMALMAAKGELTPMPDSAIFADTQAEPKKVYEWLDWLEKQLPFPVYRVSKGSLEEASLKIIRAKKGNDYMSSHIPAFTTNEDGSVGIAQRQCTQEYKIQPIMKKVRELVGRKKTSHAFQWIGISLDEVSRMKPSRVKYITNLWPLIDKRMTRQHCLKWMASHGYPKPPRSACYFCPFHNTAEWLGLSEEDKKRAVEYERKMQYQMSKIPGFTSVKYLHKSRRPLEEFFMKPKESDLFDNQFNNECEGMCGV